MGRDTKSEICAAAAEIIAAKGYEATSLREIAESVGIKKASLYYHFASKDELVDAMLRPLLDDLTETIDRIDTTPRSMEAAEEVLGHFIDALISHRCVGIWLSRDVNALRASERSIKDLAALLARLHVWLAGPDPTVEDRIRAVAATEIVGGVLSSMMSVADAPPDVLRRTLLESSMAVLPQRDKSPASPTPPRRGTARRDKTPATSIASSRRGATERGKTPATSIGSSRRGAAERGKTPVSRSGTH